MTVLRLDGDDWQLRPCLGEEWRWHLTPDQPRNAPGWLPARVPGSVIDDLWRAGEVPDPYVGRNSLLLEWAPARAWLCRRWVDVPPLAEGDRAVLCFDGVDHAASLCLDGEQVAEHEGSFVPFQVDVTSQVASGGRRLLAAALGVTLEDGRPHEAPGWAVAEDNLIHLLPGESRAVRVVWRAAPAADRALRISGFNLEERRVC
ncbi:MAG: hypothetical protein GEU94_04445 [Micromonosporaceae bacterium]|nr:hypothetical protein [Micromonosporaceae bacterium]